MTYEELQQQARRSEAIQEEATLHSAIKAVLGILASRLDGGAGAQVLRGAAATVDVRRAVRAPGERN